MAYGSLQFKGDRWSVERALHLKNAYSLWVRDRVVYIPASEARRHGVVESSGYGRPGNAFLREHVDLLREP